MQRKDRLKLANILERQGGTVRKTRSGFIARHPHTKKCVSWHSSPSGDSRYGDMQTRQNVIGAGFTWPFSH